MEYSVVIKNSEDILMWKDIHDKLLNVKKTSCKTINTMFMEERHMICTHEHTYITCT